MPTSNSQVSEALEKVTAYFSSHTGDEVEKAIETANAINAYIDTNVAVPVATMTGDFVRSKITTLDKDMWLESITLYCQKAFTASSSEFIYEVDADTSRILAIPNAFMRDEGTTLSFNINKLFAAGTTFTMVCSNTRSYGEVLVKLNFR